MIRQRSHRGFTLIEIMITVVIISVLAAIAIPGYIGLQEKGKKGAVTRSVSAGESEIAAWLQSARRGGPFTEVDSSGDSIIDNNDINNATLALDLTVANQLCSRYIIGRWNTNSELSPWLPATSLWLAGPATPGRISCSHASGGTQIFLAAQDRNGYAFYSKSITSD